MSGLTNGSRRFDHGHDIRVLFPFHHNLDRLSLFSGTVNLWLTNRYKPEYLKVYSATVTQRLDVSAEILKILHVVEGKLSAI